MDALRESLKAVLREHETEVVLTTLVIGFILGFLAKAMVF